MKDALNYLFESNTLTRQEATRILKEVALGKYNHSQVASFLTVYRMRSITVEELEGFRDAMLDLCHYVDFSAYAPVDLCGTGGDHKDTFNISTLASFVVAGAGIKVAKHGNYGVSSICGSSNVMEYLGVQFTNDRDRLERQMEKAGICILHAPMFHPAMRFVAPIRKELGFKTFFNMLGPMVNPTFPKFQLVGVFSLELARLYSYLYQKSNKNYIILHSLDGYDEISLTSSFKMISRQKEQIIEPEKLGFTTLDPGLLGGGKTIADSARIFMEVLSNQGTTEQEKVVLANAAMAILCVKEQMSMAEALDTARESLKSGKALKAFETLLEN
jgi:anthranilate phosphoribosyltransferase